MQPSVTIPAAARRVLPPGGSRWMQLLLASSALLVVGSALAWGYQRFIAPAPAPPLGQVVAAERGTISTTVSATGSVVATKRANLSFGTSGRLSEINVQVGERVQAGQVLARVASESLQLRLDQARSQLATAQLQLERLARGATEADVEAAQAAYNSAVARLEELTAGPNQADLKAAQASVGTAQASYDQALARVQTLASGSAAADMAAAEASVTGARNSLVAAEARLEQLVAGPSQDELVAAQTSVDQARASLRSAEAKLAQAEAGPVESELVAAQTAYDQARSNLTSAEVKLELVRLSSAVPVDLVSAQSTLAAAEARLHSAHQALAATNDDLNQARASLDAQRASHGASQRNADETCETEGTSAAACLSALASVESSRTNLLAAETRVKQLEGDESWGMIAARKEVDSAQVAFDAARLKYEQVKAGAHLPVDLVSAQSAYDNAVASVENARARLEQVKSGTLPADLTAARSSVESARASLASAEAKLSALQQGPNHADVVAAETAVETARANLASAEARLVATNVTTAQDLGAARAAIPSAAASLESARAKLEQLQQGATAADLEAARGTVASAQSALAAAAGVDEHEMALQLEAVRQAELSVRQAHLDLDNATLVAPFDGVVAAIHGNVGEMAGSVTDGFLVLIDPEAVRVDVTVDEADVAQIQVGKTAEISFDALPGRVFQGGVVAIAPNGTTTQGVVTYPVSLSIDTRAASARGRGRAQMIPRADETAMLGRPGSQPAAGAPSAQARRQPGADPSDSVVTPIILPAGLTASVLITIDQKDDVIMVPNRAVRRQGANQVVEVLGDDEKPVSRVVQTGVSNDQMIEILDGVTEGERVIIPATTTRAPSLGPGVGGGPGFGGPVVKP